MNASQLFDNLHNSYLDSQNLGRNPNPSSEIIFTFCNVLYESQTLLTKDQIDKMMNILTKEQITSIQEQFEKDNQFWY